VPGVGVPGAGAGGAGQNLNGLFGSQWPGPGGVRGRFRRGGPGGGMFGGDSTELQAAIRYANAHGGGTIGVESQSSAAAAILASHADVAGLGGFSGRESSVTVSWLAAEVTAGRLSWLLVEGGNQRGPTLAGDTRTGSQSALSAIEQGATSVTLTGGATLYHLTTR
jgi:hypothetical protein